MATGQSQHRRRGSGDEEYVRKIYEDFSESYGDGGGGVVEYPVWFCDRLRVPEDVRRRLARALRSLDRSREDVQPNGVVRDIIDPSLNARMLDEAERRGLAGKISHGGLAGKIGHEDMEKARGAFQWVPTVARLTKDADADATSSAVFLGDIAGLPERRFCEHLYSDLERVLSEMMPFLAMVPLKDPIVWDDYSEELPNPARSGGDLQVVVKAQRYVIPPHSTYTGRWHTEGFSENIVAAGVYYVNVSEATSGGDLSFRPTGTPDAFYFDLRCTDERGTDNDQHWWHHYVKDVPVGTGTAAVFANSMPHRFRSIRNDTDSPQRRLFVNFFFVSPGSPLECTTSSRPSPSFARRVLSKNGIQSAPVQQQVLDFVGGYTGSDFLHRRVTRDRARAAMSADRPHWRSQLYGNCGCIVYHVDSRHEFGAQTLGDGENYSSRDLEHSGCNTSRLGSGF